MPFSMIASKKAVPLAALIRKLALSDACVIKAASIQATRSFNTNAMREVEALNNESNLCRGSVALNTESNIDRGSDRRVAWRRAPDNDLPFFSRRVLDPFSQTASIQATRSFNTNATSEVEALDDDNVFPVFPRVSNPFSQIRTEDFTSPAGVPAPVPLSKRSEWYADEDEDRLEIRFDMPGLGKEHVNVKVGAKLNNLIINGDGEEEKGENVGARRYKWRIAIPNGYKLNEIEAEMKNDILKIVVPKVKEEKWFQINVKGDC